MPIFFMLLYVKGTFMKRMYNVIFPIWVILVIAPWLWLIMIPLNFLIDWAVLYFGLKHLKYQNIAIIFRQKILKIVGFGFLADIIGIVILFLLNMIFGFIGLQDILFGINFNPFSNCIALLVMVGIIIIVAIIIYKFNYHLVFKDSNLSWYQRHHLCFYFAIYTAPYLFVIPSIRFYNF